MMFYDRQTDKLYTEDTAMEGIFSTMVKAGKDGLKKDIKDIKEFGYTISGKKRKDEKEAVERNRKPSEEEIAEIKKKYNCRTRANLNTLIEKFINNEFKKIKTNKELMSKIRKFCKEYDCAVPSFSDIHYNSDGYFEIIDSDQDCSMEFSNIVDDIAEKLTAEYGDLITAFGFKVGTGDGDEGCLYLDKLN